MLLLVNGFVGDVHRLRGLPGQRRQTCGRLVNALEDGVSLRPAKPQGQLDAAQLVMAPGIHCPRQRIAVDLLAAAQQRVHLGQFPGTAADACHRGHRGQHPRQRAREQTDSGNSGNHAEALDGQQRLPPGQQRRQAHRGAGAQFFIQ